MQILIGEVKSGYGAAARDVKIGVYGDLGYLPYHGTLNLKVVYKIDIKPLPFRIVHYWGIARMLWNVRIGSVTAHMLHTKQLRDIVEIIAPVKLRDVLCLKDGDRVAVEVA